MPETGGPAASPDIEAKIKSVSSVEMLFAMNKEYYQTGDCSTCLLCMESILGLDSANPIAHSGQAEYRILLLKSPMETFNEIQYT